MRKANRLLRFLVIALIIALLCPAGAVAQDSLTVTVHSEGRQVTVQGTANPNTGVTILVTRSLDGNKSYIDRNH